MCCQLNYAKLSVVDYYKKFDSFLVDLKKQLNLRIANTHLTDTMNGVVKAKN